MREKIYGFLLFFVTILIIIGFWLMNDVYWYIVNGIMVVVSVFVGLHLVRK